MLPIQPVDDDYGDYKAEVTLWKYDEASLGYYMGTLITWSDRWLGIGFFPM